ncbi:MAG: hypothetical protein FWG59_05525 [Betaproteobacteria bacterium]|nr:hypothetical protein [Betaproteobacteria bacterium]
MLSLEKTGLRHERKGAFLIRAVAVFCLLLCALRGHALAGTLGIGGEWAYYGSREAVVRIDEESGSLEDGTSSYSLFKEQGSNWCRVAKKGSAQPGDGRKLVRVQENVLLFLGAKNPVLVRKGAHFRMPREKIRGRWHYVQQMNELFYYDAEFDLDAGKMVEISRSESGGYVRSEGRQLKVLLDAQAELALQTDGAVYHFMRLGTDFLILEPSYATSSRNGFKILMERVQAPVKRPAKAETARQADGQRASATAKGREKNRKDKEGRKKQAIKTAEPATGQL